MGKPPPHGEPDRRGPWRAGHRGRPAPLRATAQGTRDGTALPGAWRGSLRSGKGPARRRAASCAGLRPVSETHEGLAYPAPAAAPDTRQTGPARDARSSVPGGAGGGGAIPCPHPATTQTCPRPKTPRGQFLERRVSAAFPILDSRSRGGAPDPRRPAAPGARCPIPPAFRDPTDLATLGDPKGGSPRICRLPQRLPTRGGRNRRGTADSRHRGTAPNPRPHPLTTQTYPRPETPTGVGGGG